MIRVKKHYTILVYPFIHNVTNKEANTRFLEVQSVWRTWWHRLADPSPADHFAPIERALDDTYFFLPHIRKLLFPETTFLAAGEAYQQVPRIEGLMRLELQDFAKRLAPYSMLRLTYDTKWIDALNPLILEFKSPNQTGDGSTFSGSFRVCWIDIALLPQDIGFLFLKVQTDEEEGTVDRLNDLLYYMRQVHKPAIDWNLARWKHSVLGDELEFTSRDLVDFLLQGFTQFQPDSVNPNFQAWLDQADPAQRYSSTEWGQVYGQSFRLYTYACLEDSNTDGTTGPAGSTDHSVASEEGAPFDSNTDRILYELATCTKTDDYWQDYLPHHIGVKDVMEKGHIALWKNWEGMALHDNVVFLATRPSPFTLSALPQNIESDYFHLYLLTLYQKMRLSTISGELMRRGDDLYKNLHEARLLWDKFTMFRNHFWFREVTFKPQGTELYARFRQGLNVLLLYEAVSSEVQELQQYYERKAEAETADATRKLQENMAKNVEAAKLLQQAMNENVEIATKTAENQLGLMKVMTENAEVTNKLQVDMTKQLRIVANIQMKVELIEIFIVGFYCAELTHIIISLFEKNYDLKLWWSTVLILGSGLIASLVTWKLLGRSSKEGS